MWCRAWRRRSSRHSRPACPSQRPPWLLAPLCGCCRVVPAFAAGAATLAARPRQWRPPPATSPAAPTPARGTTRRPGWTPLSKPWRCFACLDSTQLSLPQFGLVCVCERNKAGCGWVVGCCRVCQGPMAAAAARRACMTSTLTTHCGRWRRSGPAAAGRHRPLQDFCIGCRRRHVLGI